ncbi:MAG: hypothetical protein AAFO01_14835 [Pseudomonadota bacterium]
MSFSPRLIVPLIAVLVLLFVGSVLYGAFQKLTGTAPEPPTAEEIAAQAEQARLDKRKRSLLMGLSKALRDHDLEKIETFFANGVDPQDLIQLRWDRPSGGIPITSYVLTNWDPYKFKFDDKPSRDYRQINETFYAPDRFFEDREKVFEVVKFLAEKGVSPLWVKPGSANPINVALNSHYIPLLEYLEEHGWSRTDVFAKERFGGEITPLQALSERFPMLGLQGEKPCERDPYNTLCKDAGGQIVFDWLLEAPGHNFARADSKGRTVLHRGLISPKDEAEAIFRIKFWKERGVPLCTVDEENEGPEDLMLARGWTDAFALLQCSG